MTAGSPRPAPRCSTTGSRQTCSRSPRTRPWHTPTTILWNVPGTGHHPISDAIESSIETAERRIHIVNPYLSNRAILARLLAAAQRGVAVELVVPGKPTPPYPAAAFRHHYRRLIDAGATILLHPDMAHAKVLSIDDRVFIGGCNLDDLSLFRNDEIDLLFEDPGVVTLTEGRGLRRARRDVHPCGDPDRARGAGRGTRRWTAFPGCSRRRSDAPIPRRGRHRRHHRAGDPRRCSRSSRCRSRSRSGRRRVPIFTIDAAGFWVFLIARRRDRARRPAGPAVHRGPDRATGPLDDGGLPRRRERDLAVGRDPVRPATRGRGGATPAVVPRRSRALHGALVARGRASSGSMSPIIDDNGERPVDLATARRAPDPAPEPDHRERPAPAGLRHDLSIRARHRPRAHPGRRLPECLPATGARPQGAGGSDTRGADPNDAPAAGSDLREARPDGRQPSGGPAARTRRRNSRSSRATSRRSRGSRPRPSSWTSSGRPVEDHFIAFEHEPFAAASTAQVHRATLPDGRQVAVKIQRPRIVAKTKADLGVLEELAQGRRAAVRRRPQARGPGDGPRVRAAASSRNSTTATRRTTRSGSPSRCGKFPEIHIPVVDTGDGPRHGS